MTPQRAGGIPKPTRRRVICGANLCDGADPIENFRCVSPARNAIRSAAGNSSGGPTRDKPALIAPGGNCMGPSPFSRSMAYVLDISRPSGQFPVRLRVPVSPHSGLRPRTAACYVARVSKRQDRMIPVWRRSSNASRLDLLRCGRLHGGGKPEVSQAE
jgi:hypothetical protein